MGRHPCLPRVRHWTLETAQSANKRRARAPRATKVRGIQTLAPLVQAIVAAAIAVGFVLYYRTLKRWGRRP